MISDGRAHARGLLGLALAVASGGACSSSSSSTVHQDAGSTSHVDGSADARDSSRGTDGGLGCPSSNTCTGAVSGGVNGAITSCSVSGEDGVSAGFGEVTFTFAGSATDGGAQITGSGNVSTSGKFAAGTYRVDAGLWNDTMPGVAADSLWTVTWTSDAGATEMALCNGIASPDEIPSVCTSAALDVTGVDACDDLHGTFDVTLPAYQGAPTVAIHLAF